MAKLERHYKNKVIWINGATSDIGMALALQLSGAGSQLILTDTDLNGLEKIRSLCHNEVVTIPYNKCSDRDIELVTESAVSAYGSIDVFINIDGKGPYSTDLASEKLDKNIEFAKCLLPYLDVQQDGHIIVMYSPATANMDCALHGIYSSLIEESGRTNMGLTIASSDMPDTNSYAGGWLSEGQLTPAMISVNNRMAASRMAWQILKTATKQMNNTSDRQSSKEWLPVDYKRFIPGLLSTMISRLNFS